METEVDADTPVKGICIRVEFVGDAETTEPRKRFRDTRSVISSHLHTLSKVKTPLRVGHSLLSTTHLQGQRVGSLPGVSVSYMSGSLPGVVIGLVITWE